MFINFLLLRRLRQKGHEEESLKRILEAFNALYDGTCLNDDQKDFSGERYIYANDFRLLLTTTGNLINFSIFFAIDDFFTLNGGDIVIFQFQIRASCPHTTFFNT